MKFVLAAAALASVLVAAPALAADSAMADVKTPLVCHPVAAGEKADATAMMAGKEVALMCVPSSMMMAKMHSPEMMKMIGSVAAKKRAYGPNIDGLLTPAQIDAAWKKWTDQTFNIPPSTP